jgi:hypothetical protein
MAHEIRVGGPEVLQWEEVPVAPAEFVSLATMVWAPSATPVPAENYIRLWLLKTPEC